MVSFNDIYYKIDSKMVEQGYWNLSIEEKKTLFNSELKKYMLSKINELGISNFLSNDDILDLSVIDLFQVIADNIPKEKHFETIRHFTHYILKVTESIQGCYVVWEENNDIAPENSPFADFDELGRWTSLVQHMSDKDYVKVFYFAYDVFQNTFAKKADKIKSSK